ncbi:TRAP transporter large permease [Pelagibacterium halotolerans]|uniref:TRAP transporter large permease protein n=1 Tax=Pelagibacterium halotolerans (strain DSM 22347 / JCM 15775 / CGMCC 1.7692 / B2) TaxID=1082931 RepID=G4RGQ4_PELHB|nr:TRAP transporter large permease [Pelagibacterium halotolerans]AEQ52093.1 TRAP dicarboxylate transporter, DctM subunit, unknown substrate 3 [Pelagibacterium halotolerans B2]QJR18136.1 TRAP transporter large permease [Pelagibacterium halotolerans]SDZ83315.1 TRAP transporter, DctM subunit [Pelagibacterium halotolerans]
MTDFAIGLSGIGAMFILMILRTPVGMAMLAVGFVGTWVLSGGRAANALFLTETFSAVSNYSLTVIPLFILMGNIASVAGFSKGLYDAAFAWVGRMPGGLASASILGCASFSAVSGSSVATAVTIGKVALPEMKRFGYSSSLATGAVAAGGTLGFLIPPSTGFVIYAILTEQSIGQLFMAGILPGLLLTGLFIFTVLIVTLRDPAAGPRGPRMPFGERVAATLRALPLILVIIVSIGGIYLGVFTPVEAAGIGAGLVVMMALFTGKLTLRSATLALSDTVRTTAMLYLIIIGASVLNPFLALTDLPGTLGEAMTSLGLGPYGVLLLIVLAYLVLGTFMDGLAMLVVTIPIFFPIVVGMGFDPIWFGVIAVVMIEMGMITPPVGMNVFVVKGIAQDVPMSTIFRGVLPFWLAMGLGLLLMVLFPQTALLIPQAMFG